MIQLIHVTFNCIAKILAATSILTVYNFLLSFCASQSCEIKFVTIVQILLWFSLYLTDLKDMGNNTSCYHLNDDIEDQRDIIEGVGGGLGAITCIVALVFAIVSRFYKDIVQRLFSLCQFPLLRYDETNEYRIITIVSQVFYYINMGFTFWLTVILYYCIVHLKDLRNFKKLEPIAVISSCLLSLVSAAFVPLAYIDCSEHKWKIDISNKSANDSTYSLTLYMITCYGTAGVLYFMISILSAIVFIVAIRRSRKHLQKNDNEAESLLVTNRWKILSKQLLPLVVYPVVNAVMAIILYSIVLANLKDSESVYLLSLLSSSGLITGIIIIIYLNVLKFKKKQREKKMISQKTFWSKNRDEIFMSETVASTDASTTYQYTHTSTFTLSVLN